MKNMAADRPTDPAEINKRLGKQKRILRQAQSPERRAQKSSAVQKQLFVLPCYRAAEQLLIYVSIGAELSTREMILQALSDKKQVFCPKVEGEKMEFYRIFSLQELSEGCRNIPEPSGNTERFAGAAHALVVAPGSAFDRMGHRIGYGGGYYDRYLGGFPAEKRPYCVGVCFACQLADEISPLPHDIDMDLVLYA